MRTKAAAPIALQTHAAKPLLISLTGIRLELLGGDVGDTDTRQIMKAEGAPAPVRGGRARGSKALWSRAAVEAYLSKVIESGVWPTQAEAAA